MLETYEFRLLPSFKGRFLDIAGDKQLHGREKIVLRGVVGDDAYQIAGKIDSELRASGNGVLIAGWDIKRQYSHEELAKAELLYLKIPFTHLAGEEYGTQYDEPTDCFQSSYTIEQTANGKFESIPVRVPCGICAKQAGILHIPFRRLPKRRDIYRVWGGELVISESLSRLLLEKGFTGGVQFPVCDAKGEQASPVDLLKSRQGRDLLTIALGMNLDPNMFEFWAWLYREAPRELLSDVLAIPRDDKSPSQNDANPTDRFAQLIINSKPVVLAEQSRFGENPFDVRTDRELECKTGQLAGKRPISSMYVDRDSWNGADFSESNLFVGGRQGLFRPYRLLFASKDAFQSLRERDMKGFEFEIVTLV